MTFDFISTDPIFKEKNPKWPPAGVKIEIFDLLSYLRFHFLAEIVLIDGFSAKELTFGGYVKFQIFVFAIRPILLKKGVRALFNFTCKIYIKRFAKSIHEHTEKSFRLFQFLVF